MNVNREKPNIDFIGIGVGKSATTWIMKCLSEHPAICGSKPKETHFFNRHYEEGFVFYANCFSHCAKGQLKGEYTPGYYQWQECAERIGTQYPNAKLLICLRAPLERLVSAYHYAYSRGKTGKHIDSFIQNYDLSVLRYYENLHHFRYYFSDKQIKVMLHEDIKADPKAFIQDIYQFLNVDASHEPQSLYERRNVTVKNTARVRPINRILWSIEQAIKALPNARFWIRLMRKIGIHKLAKLIFKWNRRPPEKTQPIQKRLPSLQEQQRVIEFCLEDIERLEEYLNRDLSRWKQPVSES
jgi:hypothetical protein